MTTNNFIVMYKYKEGTAVDLLYPVLFFKSNIFKEDVKCSKQNC